MFERLNTKAALPISTNARNAELTETEVPALNQRVRNTLEINIFCYDIKQNDINQDHRVLSSSRSVKKNNWIIKMLLNHKKMNYVKDKWTSSMPWNVKHPICESLSFLCQRSSLLRILDVQYYGKQALTLFMVSCWTPR